MKVECRNITYLSKREVGEDIHIVQELITDEDGTRDDIKIIKNFKRPYWVTKPIYRVHSDKKEEEDISKVDKFYSTQSDLYFNAGKRLGERYAVVKDPRIIKSSPYLYGTDIDSRTILKRYYVKKYGEFTTPYRIGVFDIEVNTITNKIIILSLVTYKKGIIAILESYANRIPNLIPRLREGLEKHIPDVSFKKDILDNLTIKVFKTEVDIVKYVFKQANYMHIDFLTGWNIKYDINEIIDRLKEKNIEPKDVFHYDKIPSKYAYFSFKEGRSKKITEAGREIPLPPEEQWHTIKSTTNYCFIDAMNSHRYVRTGGATTPGGYRWYRC